MAFCTNCGTQLDENSKFCPTCGAEQANAQPVPAETDYNFNQTFDEPVVPEVPKASGNLNILHLVWAIINILACCMPLGVAALILTVLAKDAPTAEEEAKKIKTARLCNIIGTVSAVVLFIVYIVLIVVGALASM